MEKYTITSSTNFNADGDQESVAETIAAEVGITEVHGECLPQDKLTILKELPKENHPVIMVGDGK